MKSYSLLLALVLAACSGGSGPSTSLSNLGFAHAPNEVLLMLADFENLTQQEEENELNEILTKFSGLNITQIGSSAFFKLKLPPGTNLDPVLKSLDEDVNVVLSEPNYLAETPEGKPRDLPTLGSDLLSAIPTQASLADLGLAQAHAFSTGAGITVAVIDTGLDMAHPFFAGRIQSGGFDFIGQDADPSEERDFTDNDGDGLVDEQYGHGTFVASLVLAVASDARILPVRVLNDEGFGDASTVAAGIIWAIESGADVINLSIDVPTAPKVIQEAVQLAKDLDLVVVAAAGNGGLTDLAFPARFSEVVAVTAVDANGRVPAFANVGSKVALVAPGVDLIGAVPSDLNPAAGTAHWSGTSFSVPIVAGTAALLRAVLPGVRNDQIVQRMEASALPVDLQNPMAAGRLGSGLVQPAAALQLP